MWRRANNGNPQGSGAQVFQFIIDFLRHTDFKFYTVYVVYVGTTTYAYGMFLEILFL
jgi:hypothetical protein